jgi:hypothetical protein
MAREPDVPGDVTNLIAAVLQLAETRAPGAQVPPPRGKHAEHPATGRYGHGRLLGFAPAWNKARRAH